MVLEPLWHDSEDDARESAKTLESLGTRCFKMLEEIVMNQPIAKSKINTSEQALDEAGFIWIRDTNPPWGPFEITPTLTGEEALEWLEAINSEGVN
jgi:hypothetical protein